MTDRCALGEHCHSGNDTPIRRHLCVVCEYDHARDVRALVYDFVDLTQLIPRGRHLPTDAISRPKPGPTLPLDANILALRDDIRLILTHWELRMRWAQRLFVPPGAVRDGHAVQRAVDIIAPRVDAIAGIRDNEGGPADPSPYDTGVLALLRMRELHGVARARVGHHARTIALPGQCPDRICRAETLTRLDGSDTVTCRTCGNAWTYPDYQAYVTLKVTAIEKKRPPSG